MTVQCSAHEKKIHKVDEHAVDSFAVLTADSEVKRLQQEVCASHLTLLNQCDTFE